MRLRARFGGKMIAAVLILLISAGVVSSLVFIQGMVLAKDFYIVGVSPGAPLIFDQRFHLVQVDPSQSGVALKSGQIDVYVTGKAAFYRADDRSQHAAGAIKKYLEKKEIARIADQYPLNQAFPLRVEVNYLKAPTENMSAAAVTLADIVRVGQEADTPANSPTVNGGNPMEDENPLAGQPPAAYVPSESDELVKQQLEVSLSSRLVPEFKAEFASNKQLIVPSLMSPPIPLAQVLLAFAYILPIFFISIFFTSGFIEEKLGRKLNILLSAPVTPLQIILGKMLPYVGYSLIIVVLITLIFHGDLLLALAIFLPVILFIFAIYLGVALQYRTYRDQTFFSLVAVTVITGYLVFPAMFVGINDLSYVSPLTLAVQMFRGESFTVLQYMLAAVPMLLVFLLAITVGTRVFNEEYLMNFKPLHVKIREAIYLAMDKRHLAASAAVFSLLFIPVVFMFELAAITLSLNLPTPIALGFLIFTCVAIEETAKSVTVAVTIERGLVKTWARVILLAVVSAVFFFLGEKVLLFMSLSVISESVFTNAVFAGNLLWIPLLLHCVCTTIVCLITWRFGIKSYPLALLAGSIVHGLYNLSVIGVLR
ncbi:MAG: ABC transporter permease [Dehalococcoidia bacterium]|nr:ABC transporter permease [Dehalococcoidia bacterium]